jgi:hypothetical protein
MGSCGKNGVLAPKEAGGSLLTVLAMLAVIGIIGAAIVSRAGNMGHYADKFARVREINGAFSYVQGLADCSRITTCAGPLALYPPEGETPLVATPSSSLNFGGDDLLVRASCAKVGGKKTVSVELRLGATWREIGAMPCK